MRSTTLGTSSRSTVSLTHRKRKLYRGWAPVQIPGGLVHHWFAIAFIPGVTARQVLQLSRDYDKYGELYKPDVQYAKVLGRGGDHLRVYYRFYRNTIVSVVYDAEFEIDYSIPDSSKNYSLARSIRIAEVQNPVAVVKRNDREVSSRKSLGSWQSPHIVLPTLPIGTFGHTRHDFGSK